MAEEKFLTVREAAAILGISEKEVVDLAESGAIPAYKIGGVFLRFKREQILSFKQSTHPKAPKIVIPKAYPLKDRISDFFYFNDFYILAILLIILLLLIILRGY